MKRVARSSIVALSILLSLTALLLLYPQEGSSAAREGLRLCFELIIPSLFPFFVLSSLLISLGFASLMGHCLQGLLWPLFRLGPAAATPLLLGAIGGYPVGARSAAQLYESGALSASDALRLSVFCNNCGPAFLFGVAGFGVFGSREAGVLLFSTHLGAALLLALVLRFIPAHTEERRTACAPSPTNSFSSVFPDCVRDAFSSTLNVCAYVVLFCVLLRLLGCVGFLPWLSLQVSALLPLSPALCQSLLGGFFELSGGISSLKALCAEPAALPIAAFLLGWGGLAVHCQSLPFWKRCLPSLRPYFIGKFLQGLIAAVLCSILAPRVLPAAASVMSPLRTTLPLPYHNLLRAEFLALFVLAGVYFLLSRQKGLVKQGTKRYNKSSH